MRAGGFPVAPTGHPLYRADSSRIRWRDYGNSSCNADRPHAGSSVIATLIRIVAGAQARWIGCSPDTKQRIYFANHSSHLDFPVIWASLPDAQRARTRPVAARDYWTTSRLRRYLANDVFRAIMIDRKRTEGNDNPLLPMEQALEAGDSLIIFPEGTRAVDEDTGMAPFRAGLYNLAWRLSTGAAGTGSSGKSESYSA